MRVITAPLIVSLPWLAVFLHLVIPNRALAQDSSFDPGLQVKRGGQCFLIAWDPSSGGPNIDTETMMPEGSRPSLAMTPGGSQDSDATETAPRNAPNTGVVTIRSEPSGATVRINEVPAGLTPLTLRISPVGVGFTVTLTKSGFGKWVAQTVATAQGSSLTAQLETSVQPEPSPEVNVDSAAPDSTSLRRREVTPQSEDDILASRRITADNHAETITPARTKPGPESESVPAGAGVVTIASEPSGADVAINEVPAGVTPLTLRIFPVGVGFSVTVTKSGYEKWMVQTVATARPYSLNVHLK